MKSQGASAKEKRYEEEGHTNLWGTLGAPRRRGRERVGAPDLAPSPPLPSQIVRLAVRADRGRRASPTAPRGLGREGARARRRRCASPPARGDGGRGLGLRERARARAFGGGQLLFGSAGVGLGLGLGLGELGRKKVAVARRGGLAHASQTVGSNGSDEAVEKSLG